ncbi:MAG: apolipoprotein N-acyltransferase [Candidatus Zixiibacteriota bacterium]
MLRSLSHFSPTISAALAGGLLALAFPPFPFGLLAYPAIACALWAVGIGGHPATISIRAMAWRGWVFGFVFHLGTLYWIGWVAIPGMLAMVIILALYVSAVFALCAYLQRALGAWAIWLFPVVWTAHEHLREWGALAFPWTNLSLTHAAYPALIQYADVTGDLGISFIIVLLGVSLHQIVDNVVAGRTRALVVNLVVFGLGFAVPYLYGRAALSGLKPVDTVRVAVLQGDIDSFRKWDEGFTDQSMAVYEAQTRTAAAHGAELIVWPETAAPIYLRADERYHRELRLLSQELTIPLLIGTLEFRRTQPEGYLRYNAAVALSNGHYAPDFHAKLHLVPFGEWIPFSDRFRVLDKLEVGGAHFTAGDRYVLFDHPKGPYAVAICYESAFPAIVRHFVDAGARFLVTITNDGWYGFSSGPAQHAAIAIFRSIETRCPMARAANTGISGFIDRAGLFHEATAQYVPDVRLHDLPLGPPDEKTFFVLHGMYWGQLCSLATAVLLVAAFAIRRRNP